VSILLEAFGRGLEEDLCSLLHPFYSRPGLETLEQLRGEVYGQRNVRPDLALRLALASWLEGRTDEARARFRQAVGENRQNARAHAAWAALEDQTGNPSAALEHLRDYNRLIPDQPAVQFCMGLCNEKINQPISAAMHYRRALTLADNFLPARQRLAACCLLADNVDEAAHQYYELRKRTPEDMRTRTLLASLLFHAGKFAQAANEFETAIAMEPGNWALDDPEITRLAAEGHVRDAIAKTKRMLGEQGPFPDLYVRLGNLYSLVGDDEPAVVNYREALNLQPNYLEAMVKLATHHLLLDRWDDAAECFGRAAELNDRMMVNYIGLGVAQASAGQINEASASLELASASEPNGTLLMTQMIRLHYRLSRTEQYESQTDQTPTLPHEVPGGGLLDAELLQHAERVRAEPHRADVWYHYGVLLRAANETRLSMQAMCIALKHRPCHLPSMMRLGLMLKEQGRDRFAARSLHRMFCPTDEEMTRHYSLALEFTQSGRLDELARRMQAMGPDNYHESDARASLGMSLEDLGLVDRVSGAWRTLRHTHRVPG
jgi:tetratricopeptide (TPR) repeat protein